MLQARSIISTLHNSLAELELSSLFLQIRKPTLRSLTHSRLCPAKCAEELGFEPQSVMTLNSSLGFMLGRPHVASADAESNLIGQMRKPRPREAECLLGGVELFGSNKAGTSASITLLLCHISLKIEQEAIWV